MSVASVVNVVTSKCQTFVNVSCCLVLLVLLLLSSVSRVSPACCRLVLLGST